jgi:hypothetical protein
MLDLSKYSIPDLWSLYRISKIRLDKLKNQENDYYTPPEIGFTNTRIREILTEINGREQNATVS